MPEPPPSSPPASKLDARLAALLALPPESYATVDPFEADTQKRLRRSGPLAFLRGPLEASDLEASPPASLHAFVTVRGDPRFLSGIGARIRSVAGDIATAEIPLSEARRIEAHPDVIAI